MECKYDEIFLIKNSYNFFGDSFHKNENTLTKYSFLFIFSSFFQATNETRGRPDYGHNGGKDQCTIYLFIYLFICRIEWLWIEKEIKDVLFYFSQLWYIFLCRLKIGIATTCWECILRHDSYFMRRACCSYLFNYCCCSEFWRRECLFFFSLIFNF